MFTDAVVAIQRYASKVQLASMLFVLPMSRTYGITYLHLRSFGAGLTPANAFVFSACQLRKQADKADFGSNHADKLN